MTFEQFANKYTAIAKRCGGNHWQEVLANMYIGYMRAEEGREQK